MLDWLCQWSLTHAVTEEFFVLIKHKLFEVYKEDIVCADSGLGDKELLAMENEPIRTKGRR